MIEHEDEYPELIEELNHILPLHIWKDDDEYLYKFKSGNNIPQLVSLKDLDEYSFKINKPGYIDKNILRLTWDDTVQMKLINIYDDNTINCKWKRDNTINDWEEETLRAIKC